MVQVGSYNAKPILMSKPFHKYHLTDTWYEMDIDAHNWAYMATRMYFNMQGCIVDLVCDVGFVFEGVTDDELPETMLMAARLNHIDPAKAVPFDA